MRAYLHAVAKVPIQAEFGRRVRKRRESLHLTMEELGHRSGLHWTFVGQVERGERNPTLITIARLAKGLGCDLGTLTRSLKE